MKHYTMHTFRILLGVIFLSAGVNGFIVFLGFESLFPTSKEAMILFQFDYLLIGEKALEILCGTLLLLNRFVPLAVAALLPIIVNIFLLHVFVEPSLLILSIILIIFELYLLIYYKGNFIHYLRKTFIINKGVPNYFGTPFSLSFNFIPSFNCLLSIMEHAIFNKGKTNKKTNNKRNIWNTVTVITSAPIAVARRLI